LLATNGDGMSDLANREELQQRWYHEGYFGTATLADYMREGAKAHPYQRMIFHSTERPAESTLTEMYARSSAVARGLWSLGLRPGDVLAIQVPNWLEGAITYQAAMQLGVLIVPIVHIYGPAEVGFILRQSKAKALIVPDRWRTINYLERVAAISDIEQLEHLIVMRSTGEADSSSLGTSTNLPMVQIHDWASLENLSSEPLPSSTTRADDPCLLIYTSGTTAEPKGVLHTHNTLIAEVQSLSEVYVKGPDAVSMGSFPAGHIAGVLNLLRMFVLGMSSVILDQWDPVAAASLVAQHRVTQTSGAPFHLMSLIEAARTNGNDLSSLQGFMVGAASVPPSLVEEAERAGIRAFRGYGSSEHPVISSGRPTIDSLLKRATTDGALTPGNEIRLVGEDDLDVGVGVDGEIVARGPEQFIGYNNPAHNVDGFMPGGWFRTGDIGRLDADGYLTITDRKKDVIIRGGENIASKEVEDLLALHPSVLEAAVVGKQDARYGERVVAFLILRADTTIDLAEVQRHFVALGVAKQKTPEFVEVVAELPRGMSGKVKKVELRERLKLASNS
jgi:acyl-CoA synthetase (AMP-forming)/AMP-acid ligase II